MEAAALKGFAIKMELVGPATFILGPIGDMPRGPGDPIGLIPGPVISMGLLATMVDETLGTLGVCPCMVMCIMCGGSGFRGPPIAEGAKP